MPMETKQTVGWRGLNPVPESLEESNRSVYREIEGGLVRQAAAAKSYPGYVTRKTSLKFLGTLKGTARTIGGVMVSLQPLSTQTPWAAEDPVPARHPQLPHQTHRKVTSCNHPFTRQSRLS